METMFAFRSAIRPIFERLEGTDMKKLNLMSVYHLGGLAYLRGLSVGAVFDFKRTTLLLVSLMDFVEEEKESLPAVADRASDLHERLKDAWKARGPIDSETLSALHTLLDKFETSLEDAFRDLPSYVMEPVGSYSLEQLLLGKSLLPASLAKKKIVPKQAAVDMQWAGASLVVHMATACGFHICRAADAMLRKYCDHFGAQPKGHARDWGKYIQALRDTLANPTARKKPNLRTVELLDRIRAEDRNPLIHPEDNLNDEDALVLFDLCKNAIVLMAIDIKNSP